jgi:hypothetical protein
MASGIGEFEFHPQLGGAKGWLPQAAPDPQTERSATAGSKRAGFGGCEVGQLATDAEPA